MRRPTTEKGTTTAANVMLEHWFRIFGIPERILSDRGKEFCSKLIEAIYAILDVERVNTTPGHRQCDGQSEKSVQQIKKMIRAYCNENQDNWDLGVTQLCFAYNSSVHETTGLTPFEIMFGRDPIIPIDLVYPNRLELTRNPILENRSVQRAEIGPQPSIPLKSLSASTFSKTSLQKISSPNAQHKSSDTLKKSATVSKPVMHFSIAIACSR